MSRRLALLAGLVLLALAVVGPVAARPSGPGGVVDHLPPVVIGQPGQYTLAPGVVWAATVTQLHADVGVRVDLAAFHDGAMTIVRDVPYAATPGVGVWAPLPAPGP
jgi:hypothetical protein